jgi:hypothetical protein
LQQVIAFAGEGKLCDGSSGSAELREYLRNISSELITKFGTPQAAVDEVFAVDSMVQGNETLLIVLQ